MRTWLVAAAVLWPTLLSAAAIERVRGEAPGLAAVVYLIAGRVCHQRPERSFHTHGVSWPVCGRCSGLYLAAPFGALVVLAGRSRTSPSGRRVRSVLYLAALPTAITVLLEWSGVVGVGNAARAIAALPLGAAVAWAVVSVAPRGVRANRVN